MFKRGRPGFDSPSRRYFLLIFDIFALHFVEEGKGFHISEYFERLCLGTVRIPKYSRARSQISRLESMFPSSPVVLRGHYCYFTTPSRQVSFYRQDVSVRPTKANVLSFWKR